MHFYVFGCKAYVFLPIEICANKLILHSELIIFIRYKNNEYYFICHTQGNIIFYFIHAIFDERLFSKYTNSYTKEHKLYDELLDKTSSETELLVSDLSGKDGPAPVSIPHTLIPSIQNNSPTCHSSLSLSYKSTSSLFTPGSKKSTIKIEETNDADSNIKMQPPSPQWPLQSVL